VNIETQVLALFEEGNPIPDLDGLEPIEIDAAAYLATLEQRSSQVTQVDTKQKDQEKKKTVRQRWLVAAVVIILAGIALVLVNQGDETPVATQPGPDEVLADYLEVWNAEDAEAVMVFYAEDAVIEGHPEDTDGLATGKSEILPIEQRMQIHQGSTGRLEFINMVVSGDTVTFDNIFHNGDGDCFSSTGDEVTVADDKITLWVFGLDAGRC
jgi:hypothetical protein